MRAVNLIPADERRGSAAGSSSGLGSYLILGVLAVVVAVSAAYTLANKSIEDHRHQLTEVQARAQAASAEVQALQSYTNFTTLRQKRVETVRSLALSRFDWGHALHEVGRTLPSNAWLTSLRATVTPNATAEGATTDPLRGSINAPAIEIVGCTTSQKNVAKVIASLRRADGVQRVSLSSSERLAGADVKGGGDSAGAGTGASNTDCRNGSNRFPQFSMTLFFQTPSVSGTLPTAKGTTP